MTKSQETISNKSSIFDRAKEAYNKADQAVIKATTFDKKSAIKNLKNAALLALISVPVGFSFDNAKASAASNQDAVLKIKAELADSPFAKTVSDNGDINMDALADLNSVGKKDAKGNKLGKTSESVTDLKNKIKSKVSEFQSVNPGSTQAEAYAHLVAKENGFLSASQEVYDKLGKIESIFVEARTQNKPIVTPKSIPNSVPNTPSNPSTIPDFKGVPSAFLKNAENLVGAILPRGEAASAAEFNGQNVKVDKIKVFTIMKERRENMKKNQDRTFLSISDNVDDFTRDLLPGVSREGREKFVYGIGLKPYFQALTLDLQKQNRTDKDNKNLIQNFGYIANALDNAKAPVESVSNEVKNTDPNREAAQNVLNTLLVIGAGVGAFGTFTYRRKSKKLEKKLDQAFDTNKNTNIKMNEKIVLLQVLQDELQIKNTIIDDLNIDVAALDSALGEKQSTIDSLVGYLQEGETKIESLNDQINDLNDTLNTFRNELAKSAAVQTETNKKLQELEAKIPKTAAEIKKSEDKTTVNEFVELLRNGFAKLISSKAKSHEIKIGKLQIDKLEGIDQKDGFSNAEKLVSLAAEKSGFSVDSVTQTPNGLKISIKIKEVSKVNEQEQSEWDIFETPTSQSIPETSNEPSNGNLVDDIASELDQLLSELNVKDSSIPEAVITPKLEFVPFDLKSLSDREKTILQSSFRSISTRREFDKVADRYFTLSNENLTGPIGNLMRKIYPNILSELNKSKQFEDFLNSYGLDKNDVESKNKYFNYVSTPELLKANLNGFGADSIIGEVIAKIIDQVKGNNLTQYPSSTPSQPEKTIPQAQQETAIPISTTSEKFSILAPRQSLDNLKAASTKLEVPKSVSINEGPTKSELTELQVLMDSESTLTAGQTEDLIKIINLFNKNIELTGQDLNFIGSARKKVPEILANQIAKTYQAYKTKKN